jgi:hypothetical protein
VAFQTPSVATVQSVAIGIFTVVGVWIAARQMVIANDRLQMEEFQRLYSRRVKVYEETRTLLAKVFSDDGVSEVELRTFGLYALDAQFLFDDEMYHYLKELRQRVASLTLVDSAQSDSAERSEYIRIRKENLDWIVKQGDEHSGFAIRFKPFLAHSLPKRSWWLRWPA